MWWKVAAPVALAGIAFTAGWKVHGWRADSHRLAQFAQHMDAMRAREEQRDEIDRHIYGINRSLAQLRTDKPVVCNFTDEQLRHVNAALRGPVSAAADDGGPEPGRGAGSDRGDSPPVPRLRRSPLNK